MTSKRQCLCCSLLCLFFCTVILQLCHNGLLKHVKHLLVKKQLHQTSLALSDIRRPQILTPFISTDPPSSSSVLSHHISFPHGDAVRDDVLNAPWVSVLRETLHKFPSKQLNLVASNGQFRSILLNWLISSLVKLPRPLDNVLVIALDSDLHTLLEERGVPSVYVDNTTVVSMDTEMQTRYSHIWITRTTVYRLISHWGYDIAVFDSDAILLQNPTQLFDTYKDVDMIGSAGSYPFLLGEKWGVTFCMGVALFRHTHRTELLWEVLAGTRNFSMDDQVKLNYALDECSIQWSPVHVQTETVLGECAADKLGGLRVAVLPHSVICRKAPCASSLYVLHRNSRKESSAKRQIARTYSVWYLRPNWTMIDSRTTGSTRLTGTEWLRAIARS